MALRNVRVVELIGLAPGPFCGKILADFGATVNVIHRVEGSPLDIMSNGKRLISVNLKAKEGKDIIKKLCKNSDVLIDTYRPGVLEKLGLGPEVLLNENKRLIYARLSGFGQDGCYKNKAGHDINYSAMSGVLSMLAKNKEPPSPPINILADFAGGSLLCALGIVIALFERNQSNKGQVIDCSMTEGAAYIASWLFKSRIFSFMNQEPGCNVLDGGAAFYKTYKTKDGKFMAVGAIESQFYSQFLNALQLSEETYSQYSDQNMCKKKFEEIFLTKTQSEWSEIFKNLDACVTPVIDFNIVDKHELSLSRSSFYRDNNNLVTPEPAPRLSRTPAFSSGKKETPDHGQHTLEILKELGYTDTEIDDLIKNGIIFAKTKSKI
ncbi:unnamed protein product [Leptidea sinapis]|uniref:Alpha-methylacyl-CoA racemase n=1 Tax=Leptidea sinapis TaxID=189913 RepID=A0A5E4Q4F7_9NEOP|nr:unnamed protein product [Leptidea sinapis]